MSSSSSSNHSSHGQNEYLHHQQHGNGNGNSGNGSSTLNQDNMGNHFWPPPQIIPYSYYSSAQQNPNSANHSLPSNTATTSSNNSSNHSYQHYGHSHHNSNTSPSSSSHHSSFPPPPPHWSPPSSSNQDFHLPDAHPVPYQDHQAPFPLPLGMRIVGGKNLPEEDENESDQPWDAFAMGSDPPPTRQTRRKRVEPPSDTGLGKTRCYWVLLSSTNSSPQYSPDLNFIYLDPVLQRHMGTEATAMLGTSFFDYVHPDEKERTLADMSKIGEAKTLFGSVTRCRYSRVPHIRSLLGCAAPPQASDSYKYIFDEHYLAIDIVINWVGDGLALAFFHAVIDKSPEDNDEARKTEWTNWCGTPAGMFSEEEIEKIWTQVLAIKKNHNPMLANQAPEHVFQILEAGNDGDILFSWPPPRLFNGYLTNADALEISLGSNGQSYGDGSYFADDFARLAQGVSCSPNGTNPQGANTSCTRRFRAKHTLTSEGLLRSIESVLIPYGSLVLACFKTTYQQVMARSNYGGSRISPSGSPYGSQNANLFPSSATSSSSGQHYNSSNYHHPSYNALGQPHSNLNNAPTWIPLASGNSIGSTYDANGRPYPTSSDHIPIHQHPHHPHHQQRSSLGSLGELADATIAYADAPPGSGPAGLAPIGIENSPGQASMRLAQNAHLNYSSHHHPHQQLHPHPHHPHHSHPGMMQMNAGASTTASPLNSGSGVGGSKRKREDGEGKSRLKPAPTPKMPSDGTLEGATQAASSHPGVNQNGEKCCTGCGTVNSPEWRKGPTGGKSLCNACGLRYSRAVSRAKKKEAALNGTPIEPKKKKKDDEQNQ